MHFQALSANGTLVIGENWVAKTYDVVHFRTD